MGLLDGIGSALDSGAVDAAVDVGTDPTWWETGISYATDAFGWMEDNPEVTNVLAGVVAGAGQYYMAKEQQDNQQRFERDMMARKKEDRRIQPGAIKGYGSHVATAKSGLLTNGMIIGEE